MMVLKAAIGDVVLTFIWVLFASSIGAATTALGLQPTASLLITAFLIFIQIFILGTVADALGGACFNPADIAALYAAGMGGDTLTSAAVRFPAQAIGAAAGVLAIVEFMPSEYKHMFAGPALKVDLHTGAIAEGVLTFTITFLVLCIIHRGPKNIILKNWMLSMTIVALIVAGSSYTGPSMNPANAFGWAYVNNRHNTWEHLYVFWICPFAGAILGAWVFRLLFPAPAPAPKKKVA